MTQLAVGRAFDGLDVAPREIQFDGVRLSLAGPILPTSFDILKAARDRVVALPGNVDEMAVPVTFTEDPSIDGYYRVLSSACVLYDHTPTTGFAQWAVEMERIGGAARPQIEVYGLHTVRVNPHSITNATLDTSSSVLVGVPFSTVDFWHGAQSTAFARTSASGDMSMYDVTQALPEALIATFSVPPADAYDGACHIRTTYGSATGLLVGGRYAPGLFGDGWVLSNDLIRVYRHPSISTALQFEVWDGVSAWEQLAGGVGWRLEHDYGGGSNVQWDLDDAPVTVLRNSPEVCTIRLAMAGAAVVAQFGRVWLDLTVKRGQRIVACVAQCDTLGSLGGVMAIEPTTSIASTSLTGSIRATSNDAAGNRAVWGVAGAVAVTANTTTGRIVQNSTGVEVMPWFVGCEFNGSSAGFNAQAVTYEYYDIRNETQRVVRR